MEGLTPTQKKALEKAQEAEDNKRKKLEDAEERKHNKKQKAEADRVAAKALKEASAELPTTKAAKWAKGLGDDIARCTVTISSIETSMDVPQNLRDIHIAAMSARKDELVALQENLKNVTEATADATTPRLFCKFITLEHSRACIIWGLSETS